MNFISHKTYPKFKLGNQTCYDLWADQRLDNARWGSKHSRMSIVHSSYEFCFQNVDTPSCYEFCFQNVDTPSCYEFCFQNVDTLSCYEFDLFPECRPFTAAMSSVSRMSTFHSCYELCFQNVDRSQLLWVLFPECRPFTAAMSLVSRMSTMSLVSRMSTVHSCYELCFQNG
jgi:hypothetical protein